MFNVPVNTTTSNDTDNTNVLSVYFSTEYLSIDAKDTARGVNAHQHLPTKRDVNAILVQYEDGTTTLVHEGTVYELVPYKGSVSNVAFATKDGAYRLYHNPAYTNKNGKTRPANFHFTVGTTRRETNLLGKFGL